MPTAWWLFSLWPAPLKTQAAAKIKSGCCPGKILSKSWPVSHHCHNHQCFGVLRRKQTSPCWSTHIMVWNVLYYKAPLSEQNRILQCLIYFYSHLLTILVNCNKLSLITWLLPTRQGKGWHMPLSKHTKATGWIFCCSCCTVQLKITSSFAHIRSQILRIAYCRSWLTWERVIHSFPFRVQNKLLYSLLLHSQLTHDHCKR